MHRIIASGFGTGLILGRLRGSDSGSGTVGAAFALAASIALHSWGWQVQLATLVVVSGLSVWASERFATDGDPGWVVIDEVAGTFLATLGLAGSPAVIAWAVFRVADIWKSGFWGVAAAERLPGGWGITADDLVAGLYGLAAGWAVQLLL